MGGRRTGGGGVICIRGVLYSRQLKVQIFGPEKVAL